MNDNRDKPGVMYSCSLSDEEECEPVDGAPRFPTQGFPGTPAGLAWEVALQLGATMADHLGCVCSPTFSWNAGMMMHIFRGGPALGALDLAQVQLGNTPPASQGGITSYHASCIGEVKHCCQTLV